MTGSRLVAKHLSKSFAGVAAVSDVSLEVKANELVVLIGPNGAGKTTIFNLLTGVHSGDAGQVFIGSDDVTGWPLEERARGGIGRTFQDVRLFGAMSVLENVEVYSHQYRAGSITRTLARPRRVVVDNRAARQRALASLERIGIVDLADRRVEDLSYAQQKLVSIARVLALRAKIVLLDEPASGVDERGREQLCTVVRQLASQDLAVCVVEHNLDVVRSLADRIIFLAEGRVLAEGAPASIFASSELADVYFGSGAVTA